MEYKYYYNYEDDLYYSEKNKIDETKAKLKKSFKIGAIIMIVDIIIILASLIYMIINGFAEGILMLFISFIVHFIKTFSKYKTLKLADDISNEPFEKDYQEEITLQITKKGIIEKDQYNNKFLNKWKNIKKINKNKNYLDIIMKKGSNIIIPLRVFNDENDLNNFLDLLKTRTHVPISRYEII